MTLTQTDTNSDLTFVTCAGTANAGGTSAKAASSGGTAGTTAVTITADLGPTNRVWIEAITPAGVPGSLSWEAGQWTVRLEITTANMNIGVPSVTCCRLNSAGVSQGAVDGMVGQTMDSDLSTTGVKTVTFTRLNAQAAAVGDRLSVQYGATNSSSCTSAFAYKPSQDIDTPISQGGAMYPPWPPVLNVGLRM